MWCPKPSKPYSFAEEIPDTFAIEHEVSFSIFRGQNIWKLVRNDVGALSHCYKRHAILGNDLAPYFGENAIHSHVSEPVLTRTFQWISGNFRIKRSSNWAKQNHHYAYDSPSLFDPEWIITAKVQRLYELKSFSLKNVKQLDDWCVDRLTGNQFEKLEEFDVTSTNVTANGLAAIPKIQSRKVLIASDIIRSVTFWLSLKMFEDIMPCLCLKRKLWENPDATAVDAALKHLFK